MWPAPEKPASYLDRVRVMRYRLGLLGDPVDRSRSPLIHHEMLAISGLDGVYQAIRADEPVLVSEVERLRRGERHGLNVTMPLKALAAATADELTPQAEMANSVNTLSRLDDSVIGHSTDAQTFEYLFTAPRFSEISTLLVLGAGGSAAAALAARPDKPTYVAARRTEQAAELTGALGGVIVGWGTPVAGALVVNTTPLGMNGEEAPRVVLRGAAGLIDLPYGAEQTPAVSEARRIGLPVADGAEFLVRQAIASFRIWTGVDIAYETLVDRLRNA